MQKNLIPAFIAFIALTSAACADVEIRNDTSGPIRVFLGAHNTHPNRGKIYQKHDMAPGEITRLAADKKQLELAEGEYFFDLIASKRLDNKIDPDWRLLAGECSKLHVDHDVTVVIAESTGGVKTSCTVIGRK